MALTLTSLQTNIYDAQPHCQAVNASVMAELMTRESVQKELQQARDAEAAASQALAIVTDTAYTNTIKSSCGDLMTTASVVPSVVEQSPATIIADNALGAQVAAAAASVSSVGDAAAAATNPADAAAAISQVANAMNAGNGGMPTADSLMNSMGDIDTASLEDAARLAADMYIKEQTCGICDLDDADMVAGMLADGAPGIADTAMTALTTGEYPELDYMTADIPYDALVSEFGDAAELQEAALKAAQQAAIDTSKTASLNLAKQSISALGEGIVTNLNNGTLTPNVLLDNFDTNMGALGEAIAGYVGAAVADVPGSNPCSSQAVTNFGLGCAALVSTTERICKGANFLLSKAGSFADQAENILAHGPELVIAMAESAIQNAANTGWMAIKNAGSTNCNIGLAVNVIENTITSAQRISVAGQAVLAQADRAKGAINNLVNTCKHTDDLVEKGKKLVQNHPLVKVASNGLKFKATDMKSYDMLTNTGIKFARVVMGTERQNMLSSASKSMNRSKSYKQLVNDRKTYATTTAKKNRYNLYGLNGWFLDNYGQ